MGKHIYIKLACLNLGENDSPKMSAGLDNSKVRILFFAKARELVNQSETFVDLDSVSDPNLNGAILLGRIIKGHPELEVIRKSLILALNEEYIDVSDNSERIHLKSGDEIAVIPPVSGGRSNSSDIHHARL